MRFFGKFEKDNNKVFRTKTYLSLGDGMVDYAPENKDIIGTIYMLNPGSSHPKGCDPTDPFLDYTFGTYVDLETDATMNVFIDVFKKLREDKGKYLDGIIEVKNLFNYREATLSNEDWQFIISDIANNETVFNLGNAELYGDFVFFGWGASKLKRRELKEFAYEIMNQSKDQKIIFISPKNDMDSEKHLSYYHPLGGRWKKDKRDRFNNGLYQIFDTLVPITNFE